MLAESCDAERGDSASHGYEGGLEGDISCSAAHAVTDADNF